MYNNMFKCNLNNIFLIKHRSILSFSVFIVFIVFILGSVLSHAVVTRHGERIEQIDTIRIKAKEIDSNYVFSKPTDERDSSQFSRIGVITTTGSPNVHTTDCDAFELTVNEDEIFYFYKVFEYHNPEHRNTEDACCTHETFWEFYPFKHTNNQASCYDLNTALKEYFLKYPKTLTRLLTARYICTSSGFYSSEASKILYFYLMQLLYLRKDREFFILTELQHVEDNGVSPLPGKNRCAESQKLGMKKLLNSLKRNEVFVDRPLYEIKLMMIDYLLTAGRELSKDKPNVPYTVLRDTFIEGKKKNLHVIKDRLVFGNEPMTITKEFEVCNLLSEVEFDKAISGCSYLSPKDCDSLNRKEEITLPDKKIEFTKKVTLKVKNLLSTGCMINGLDENAVGDVVEKLISNELGFMKNRVEYIRKLYHSHRYQDILEALNNIKLLDDGEGSFTEITLQEKELTKVHLGCIARQICRVPLVITDLHQYEDGKLMKRYAVPGSGGIVYLPYKLDYQRIGERLQCFSANVFGCTCNLTSKGQKKLDDGYKSSEYRRNGTMMTSKEHDVIIELAKLKASIEIWKQITDKQVTWQSRAQTKEYKFCIDKRRDKSSSVFLAIRAEQIQSDETKEFETDYDASSIQSTSVFLIENITSINGSSKWSCNDNAQKLNPSLGLEHTNLSDSAHSYDSLEEQKGLLKKPSFYLNDSAQTLDAIVAFAKEQLTEANNLISNIQKQQTSTYKSTDTSLYGVFLADSSFANSILSMSCYEKSNMFFQLMLRPVQIILGNNLESNISLPFLFESNTNAAHIESKMFLTKVNIYDDDDRLLLSEDGQVNSLMKTPRDRYTSFNEVYDIKQNELIDIVRTGFYMWHKCLFCSGCRAQVRNYNGAECTGEVLEKSHESHCLFKGTLEKMKKKSHESHCLFKDNLEKMNIKSHEEDEMEFKLQAEYDVHFRINQLWVN
ncbi:MAG: hypothetical protein QS721_05575 [Candidatus Endonucleobacter sp. (ex Gigantidas childressi)]|nr:hypothetical protein [Candidatus Endonucleobacter sp. (ex Gigantidas childressi)]